MKIKYLSILIASIFQLITTMVNAQAKDVYWVHGMGGNYYSLGVHANYFRPLYQLVEHRFEYNTAAGIPTAAFDLKDNFVYSASNKSNILVAHSMGGVNSMCLYKNFGRNYVGGLITINTPHEGAYIANNIDNGVLANIVNEGIEKGAKGAVYEPNLLAINHLSPISIDAVTSYFGNIVLFGALLKKVPEIVRSEAMTTVQTDETKNSLKVGSVDINALKNAGGSDLPSIALYGIEDYPAFLRMASSRKGKDLVSLVNDIKNACWVMHDYHKVQKTAAYLSLNFPLGAIEGQLAANWQTSIDFWGANIQKLTNVLIGAYRTYQQTITYNELTCDIPPILKSANGIAPPPSCENPIWIDKTKVVTVVVEEDSDGLMPVGTQKAMKGCIKTVELLHMNHIEVKYNTYVRDRLREIFDGNTFTERNRTFFKIEKR